MYDTPEIAEEARVFIPEGEHEAQALDAYSKLLEGKDEVALVAADSAIPTAFKAVAEMRRLAAERRGVAVVDEVHVDEFDDHPYAPRTVILTEFGDELDEDQVRVVLREEDDDDGDAEDEAEEEADAEADADEDDDGEE